MLKKLPHCVAISYKRSLFTPILKPCGKRDFVTAYRPISLNSCFSKVLDKIIAKRLWWFINTNKLLSSQQTAFKQGKSVGGNLLYLDGLITDSLSSR